MGTEIKREAYYYARDRKRRPVVTVCLLVDEAGNVARGVAICSNKDGPSKAKGREIAKSRALACLQSQGLHGMEQVQRSEALDVLAALPGRQPYHLMAKAWWNPGLTEFEREMMGIGKSKIVWIKLLHDEVVDAEFPQIEGVPA